LWNQQNNSLQNRAKANSAQEREKGEHLDTERHQGEGSGEKDETDWEEAEAEKVKKENKKISQSNRPSRAVSVLICCIRKCFDLLYSWRCVEK
jgi:hypothetical protein